MKKIFGVVFLCIILENPVFAKINADEYQKAMNLFYEKKYNETIEVLQASIKEDPNQPFLYNLLGLIYREQGESLASAVGSFEEAVRLDSNFAEAYYNLAMIYAGEGNRPDLAKQYFDQTLEVDPSYLKACFGLGWFTLLEDHDPNKAIGYFKKTIESFPDLPEAHYGIGLSYVQMGKAPMALEAVSQLRVLGREDLASLLEMAIRGEIFSEGSQVQNSESVPLMDTPVVSQESTSLMPSSEKPLRRGPFGIPRAASTSPTSQQTVLPQNTAQDYSNPFQLEK